VRCGKPARRPPARANTCAAARPLCHALHHLPRVLRAVPPTSQHTFFPKEGYFSCRACKHPLYSSVAKFKDCGWDAFDQCFFTGGKCHVDVQIDGGGLEILCAECGSHLGHVFHGEGAAPRGDNGGERH